MLPRLIALPALLIAFLAAPIAARAHGAGGQHGVPHQQKSAYLFAVGIEGGFTGSTMTATVYPGGRIEIEREGAGRGPHTTVKNVPLSGSAVKTVLQIARSNNVYAIPKSVQNATFGADIPVRFITVPTKNGEQRVQAMGSENNHVDGADAFFPVWGLLYALAGYPSQLGG